MRDSACTSSIRSPVMRSSVDAIASYLISCSQSGLVGGASAGDGNGSLQRSAKVPETD
jgi:hypothetical protein